MEHPLNPHKSYAYSPPAPLCRTATGSGRAAHLALTTPRLSRYASVPPHAADHRRAGEVLRVPEASSNLNSFLR